MSNSTQQSVSPFMDVLKNVGGMRTDRAKARAFYEADKAYELKPHVSSSGVDASTILFSRLSSIPQRWEFPAVRTVHWAWINVTTIGVHP